MKKAILDKAIRLGLKTQEQLNAFAMGYMHGELDALTEATKEIKDMANETD